jgi:hypothetical protein
MDLQEAINDPRVNVFDIINLYGGGYTVYTYYRPNETKSNFQIRHQRNLRKAEQLKKKKPTLAGFLF